MLHCVNIVKCDRLEAVKHSRLLATWVHAGKRERRGYFVRTIVQNRRRGGLRLTLCGCPSVMAFGREVNLRDMQ